MTTSLDHLVESTSLDVEQIAQRTTRIRDAVLRASGCIDRGNFTSIHRTDLECLFAE